MGVEGLIYIDICQARLSELMMSTPFFSLVRVGNDLLFEREGGKEGDHSCSSLF